METPSKHLKNRHLDNVQSMTPLKIPASPLMKTLGYGTGVQVYRLERSPRAGLMRSPWAIKKISKHILPSSKNIFTTRLKDEAEILRKLVHPNIVGFRGVQKDSNGCNSLILECCTISLGDILEERNDNKTGPLPPSLTIKMSLDISKALDYLHNEAKILHADIKSHNILVKGEFELCKLCDFGVCLPMDENNVVDFKANPDLKYTGTDLWSAPEVINDAETIDEKADIFSFGLVIYETISCIPPHVWMLDDNELEEKDNDSNEFLSEISYAFGTRPPLPEAFELNEDYNSIVELFFVCTNNLPEDRPTAKTIRMSIESMK